MDKLLNKIKLVIAPYLREDMMCTDFQKGKISLAKQIADIIDVVNDDNLKISKIDVGDVVVNKIMTGIGSRGIGRKDYGFLQFLDDDVEMFCKKVPFIPDGESNSYKIIVQKVASTENKKEDEVKVAKNQAKLGVKLRRNVVEAEVLQENVRRVNYLHFNPEEFYRNIAAEAPVDPGFADMPNA